MKKIRILVANDDGVQSNGLALLVKELSAVAEVYVSAPDGERSASSHSFSIKTPLRYSEVKVDGAVKAYAISGTPADCVKFGLAMLVKDVDLVISGINRGANLGSDIMYSGTVGAALEGAYLGVRSFAVSVMSARLCEEYYPLCASFMARNLYELYNIHFNELPVSTIFNINYPKTKQPMGVAFSHMGVQEYSDIYIDSGDGNFMLQGRPMPHNRNTEEADVELAKAGNITVSPIQIDRTDYSVLKKIKRHKLEV